MRRSSEQFKASSLKRDLVRRQRFPRRHPARTGILDDTDGITSDGIGTL